MPKIAIIFLKPLHPQYAVGGKQATALWLAHCLQNSSEITFFYLGKEVNLPELNHLYGTALSEEKIKLVKIPQPFWFTCPVMSKLGLLKQSFFWREAKKLVADFEIVVSGQGEMDLRCPIVQYINFPSPSLFFLGKKAGLIKKVHNWLCNLICPRSLESMRNNLTLTNSFYTAGIIKKVYGLNSTVVYLPVAPFSVNPKPWEEREDGFVLISRLHPEKNIDKVIEILQEVRGGGRTVHLHLIGSRHDKEYSQYIQEMIEKNSDWIFYEGVPTRHNYFQIICQHKYGIHGMPNEHFGIVIAEMISAGVIVFVPADGGQVEIVGDERLTYKSLEQAVEKVLKVLNDSALQQELLAKLKTQSVTFNAPAFCQRINKAVEQFIQITNN